MLDNLNQAIDMTPYAVPVPDTGDGIVWQDPVLFGEIETPRIDCSVLPAQLADFAKALSVQTQTPEDMSVLLILATAATCLQKRFVVSPYGDDYIEPLSLWIVVAMPPASRKTAVLQALREPLNDWEHEQAASMKLQIVENRNRREIAVKRIETMRKQAAGADDSSERERLTSECAVLESEMPDEMYEPRLWTSDITPERLQNLLVEHGERMSVIADEGGIFEVMSGQYSDGKSNIDVFLQAHAGGSVRVDRGSRQAHLNKPALTFGLAVQPAIIADLSSGSKHKFRGNGALARFLYCIPKSNIGSRAVGRSTPIPANTKALYHASLHGMLAVEPLIIDKKEEPRILVLTEQAAGVFMQFAAWIESEQGERGQFELIQDWTGKLPGAALRIAGICHVAEYGGTNLNINEQTMTRALDLCQALIGHAQAAFELMGCDPAISDAKYILKWLLQTQEKTCKQNDIHKLSRFKNGKIDRVIKAIGVLHERHILSKREELDTRKPTLFYHVNPAIFGRAV